MTLDELRDKILELPADERWKLAAWLLHQRGPSIPTASLPVATATGITRTAGVCGGDPCIVRTRIPVWALEQMRRLSVTESEILRSYPTLQVDDLDHAWAYVTQHRDEIDEQIRQNEEA